MMISGVLRRIPIQEALLLVVLSSEYNIYMRIKLTNIV